MESISHSGTDAERFVLLVDGGYEPKDFSSDLFKTISIDDISLPDGKRLYFQSQCFELCAASKAFLIEHLLAKGFHKVIFIDADVYVYRSLKTVIDKLDYHDAIITPHIIESLDDEYIPDDLTIINAGTINTGFVGVRAAPGTARFLRWWQKKVATQCFVEPAKGVFVEQKWMDLVPSLFPNVVVDHSPALNVAYWNLTHRHITCRDGEYYVNDVSLVFFHFSGLVVDEPFVFSKYENRFWQRGLSPVVKELVLSYIERLKANGLKTLRDHRYHFDYFADTNVPIPAMVRKLNRQDQAIQAVYGDDPFDISKDPGFASTYNRRIMGRRNPLTRLAYEYYKTNPTLRDMFPDVAGRDALSFGAWFVDRVAPSYNLHRAFTDPIETSLRRERISKRRVVLRRFYDALGEVANYVLEHRTNGLSPPAATLAKPKSGKTSHLRSTFTAVAGRILAWARRLVDEPARRAILLRLLRAWARSYGPPHTSTARGPAVTPQTQEGINLVGWIQGELGLGESARSTLRAANAAGIPVNAIDIRAGLLSRSEEKPSEFLQSPGAVHQHVNLFHINGGSLLQALTAVGPRAFVGHYNIGYWVWETLDFPERWRSATRFVDEIWTASTFCQDVLSRNTHVPIVRIPHNVEPVVPPGIERKHLRLPESGFLFLCMADFLSTPERKNPIGALEAFQRAWGDRPQAVYFVLKISNSNVRPDAMKIVADYVDRNRSIILIDGYLDRPSVNALIYNCDCYVSLHRSEGFGLPLAEAMYMGKPVIGTGWSGNMDFMNIGNSLPVRYRIVEFEDDFGPYGAGHHWADPDLDHAAESMQRLLSERDLAAQLGQKASEDIRAHFSPRVAGKMMKDRLIQIRRHLSRR